MSGSGGRLPRAETLGRRIAGFGLPRGGAQAPVEVPPPLWPSLLTHLTRQRFLGVAAAAARAGFLRIQESDQEELFRGHREAMLVVLLLERRLLGVVGAMRSAGIEPVVLKGAALAHAFYPDPSWRSYGDVDLLVRAEDWTAACSVLSDLGYRRLIPEPRPGFDRRFGKGATHQDADGIQVDLHRTLTLGPFGLWMDPAELFRATAEFAVGETGLRRLGDTFVLLHACVHAAVGRRRPLLVPLRDVLQVAWSGGVDWDELREASSRWRLRGPLALGLRLAAETLEAELPPEAGALLSPRLGRLERRALEAYTTDRRDRGGLALATLWAVPGVRGKVAYLWSLAFPTPSFLRAREKDGRGGYRARWRRALRRIAARRRGRRTGVGR